MWHDMRQRTFITWGVCMHVFVLIEEVIFILCMHTLLINRAVSVQKFVHITV